MPDQSTLPPPAGADEPVSACATSTVSAGSLSASGSAYQVSTYATGRLIDGVLIRAPGAEGTATATFRYRVSGQLSADATGRGQGQADYRVERWFDGSRTGRRDDRLRRSRYAQEPGRTPWRETSSA